MIAWIAGSTGYTGSHLVEQLATQGHTVHAHVRPDSRTGEETLKRWESLGVHVERVAWEPDAQRAALERIQPDAIFSLLGITKAGAQREAEASGKSTPTYTSVDLALTVMLLDATVATVPQARFIYLSSLGVRPRSNNAYLEARWQAEEAIRERAAAWTIVRPSFITGPDRAEARPLERIGATLFDGLAKGLTSVGFSRLEKEYGSVTGAMLARNLMRLAEDASAVNQVVEAADLDRSPAPPPLRS